MKKLLNACLAGFLSLSVCGCAGTETVTEQPDEKVTVSESEETEEKEETLTQEEEIIDDPAWDTLESLGQVETENGLFFVKVTLPADFVGEEITQEQIDAGAGETYTSGKLNDDGSITYKMTKRQHRNMLDTLASSMEETLREMCGSGEYAISDITHNADFTSFDVKLTTDEIGFTEGFMVMAFCMYGGMYSLFSGKQSDITVNYYSADGTLIESTNSSGMGG